MYRSRLVESAGRETESEVGHPYAGGLRTLDRVVWIVSPVMNSFLWAER